MKSMHAVTATFVLALAAFTACGGRLNVGDKNKGGTGGTGAEVGEGGMAGGDDGGGRTTGGAGRGGMSSDAGMPSAGADSGRGGAAGDGTAGFVTSSTGGLAGSAGAFASGGRAMGGMAGLDSGVGGAEARGGGSWVDELPKASPVEGSSPDCVDGPHESGRACERKGLVCGYDLMVVGDDGVPFVQYQECTCVGDPEAPRWYCEYSGGCANMTPKTGDDCFGYFGSGCEFPLGYCQCNAESGVWECLEPAPLPPHLEPPEAVEGEHTVADLSEDERTAWCTWLSTAMAGGPGYMLPMNAAVSDGYVRGFGCMFGLFNSPCNAMVPALAVAQCAANLAVSTCGAPVSTLTACVRDVFGGSCQFEQTSCAEYFAVDGCDGTILAELWSSPTGCVPLRVE